MNYFEDLDLLIEVFSMNCSCFLFHVNDRALFLPPVQYLSHPVNILLELSVFLHILLEFGGILGGCERFMPNPILYLIAIQHTPIMMMLWDKQKNINTAILLI